MRFRDEDVELEGLVGENVDIASADPANYHEAITEPAGCPARTIDGKLFLARSSDPQPVVVIVPGSLGVGPNHRSHAATLLREGLGVLLLDPFGARSVESTVANQTPYSFAASAWDVLAALRTLAGDPRVDSRRISAQGHSRGGSAVVTAAMRRFADPIVGPNLALRGVYAVYPWCGHVFRDPDVGATAVRAIVGDRDDWVSPQQVQGQIHAIAAAGGDATVRVVPGAIHSFDRLQEIEEFPDAAVAPTAPTVFVDDDGTMRSPYFASPDPTLGDRDVFVAANKAGHGRKGATIGSTGDLPGLFRADMISFHRRVSAT